MTVNHYLATFAGFVYCRSITQSETFKVPKTKREPTVLLYPPAQEALKVLIADARQREPADLQVWLNRHEHRTVAG